LLTDIFYFFRNRYFNARRIEEGYNSIYSSKVLNSTINMPKSPAPASSQESNSTLHPSKSTENDPGPSPRNAISSPIQMRKSPSPVLPKPSPKRYHQSQPTHSQSQYYSLKWNNYQNNMTSVFHQLLEAGAFVDVTLACEENSLKAHKVCKKKRLQKKKKRI
jgi:hypothetical protein